MTNALINPGLRPKIDQHINIKSIKTRAIDINAKILSFGPGDSVPGSKNEHSWIQVSHYYSNSCLKVVYINNKWYVTGYGIKEEVTITVID